MLTQNGGVFCILFACFFVVVVVVVVLDDVGRVPAFVLFLCQANVFE